MRLRPRRSASRPKTSAPSTAPPMYAEAVQPISLAVRPSVSGPTEPTTVTSRPSSSQLTPSAITTRQCQRDQGRASSRAGIALRSEPRIAWALMTLYFGPMPKVTRWQASGLHLLISIAIAAAVLALLLLVWYPGPLFEAMGGMGMLFILVGVGVGLGPTITLIIFKQGKRGLRLALAIIGTVQLAALLYGVHVMYLARPAFIAFVKDQFQVATAAELEPERLAEAKYPQFR